MVQHVINQAVWVVNLLDAIMQHRVQFGGIDQAVT